MGEPIGRRSGAFARFGDTAADRPRLPDRGEAKLLETFKQRGKRLNLVSDQFGRIEGLVALIDIMQAIVVSLSDDGLQVTSSAFNIENQSPESTEAY